MSCHLFVYGRHVRDLFFGRKTFSPSVTDAKIRFYFVLSGLLKVFSCRLVSRVEFCSFEEELLVCWGS